MRYWPILLPLVLVSGHSDPSPQRVVSVEVPKQESVKKEEGDFPALPAPREGVSFAIQDAKQVNPFRLALTRWIWIPGGNGDDIRAVSDALAKISRSGNIILPTVYGEYGKNVVLRVDLRSYAPTDTDVLEWVRLWEEFRYDPAFNTLLTQDTLKALHRDSKSIVERYNADHLRGSGYENLQEAARSLAPIVHYSYFIGRVLSTIKDDKDEQGKDLKNPFSVIYGGLYYEFAGIRKSQSKGLTDFDQVLFDIGASDGKTPFRKVFDRLRSDERAGLKSQVTGRNRRIDWIGTQGARTSIAAPIVFITNDVGEDNIDISNDPFKNLVNVNAVAFEVIWTRRNGMQGYAIFNAKGDLIDEADRKVVTDSTVPHPHPARLQSGISCIRCHGPDSGWQPFVNEVKLVLSGGRPDVFADLSQLGKSVDDTLDRLVGQYNGEPRKPLMRARDDYTEAVMRATTFPFPIGAYKSEKVGLDVVKISSKRLGDIYALDRYQDVDARFALINLGLPSPRDRKLAAERLKQVLPPDERARVSILGSVIIPEDATMARLKAGFVVTKQDWNLSYSFFQERAQFQKGRVK